MKRSLALVALIALCFAPTASAKILTGGSFVTVWRGKSAVICANSYSVRYGYYILACRNSISQVAAMGVAIARTYSRDDGSFKFPDQAEPAYSGDYWQAGRLRCRIMSYGRVRCWSLTSSTQGFEIGKSYATKLKFNP
jgi:hypothetical protein